jgi:hypothetical protein
MRMARPEGALTGEGGLKELLQRSEGEVQADDGGRGGVVSVLAEQEEVEGMRVMRDVLELCKAKQDGKREKTSPPSVLARSIAAVSTSSVQYRGVSSALELD